MRKPDIICALYAHMMREFSQRTVAGLKSNKLFRLLLPPFRSFLEINLDKEIEKHRAVVAAAVEAVDRGQPPDYSCTERLLRLAREIDQDFLDKARSVSSAIRINYPEVDSVRHRRTELVLAATYQLLLQWQTGTPLRRVIERLYDRQQFRVLLTEILNLYVLETGVLSKSVKIPRTLTRFRDAMISTVHEVMRKVAVQLSLELTNQVYQRHEQFISRS